MTFAPKRPVPAATLTPLAMRLRIVGGGRPRARRSSGAVLRGPCRFARYPGTGEDPVRATRLVAADQELFHDSSVTLTTEGPATRA